MVQYKSSWRRHACKMPAPDWRTWSVFMLGQKIQNRLGVWSVQKENIYRNILLWLVSADCEEVILRMTPVESCSCHTVTSEVYTIKHT